MSMKSKQSFHTWLEEPIHWRGETYYPRSKVISWFVQEGLFPWIQSNGYEWGCNSKHLANCIATGLYENQGRSHMESEWSYAGKNTNFSQEEEVHFHYIISQDAWNNFWYSYGSWGDLTTNTFRGQDRRLDIQNFVWGQLDLEASPQTRELYEIILGGDDEQQDQLSASMSRSPQQDMYLKEAVEYNGWGGYRR